MEKVLNVADVLNSGKKLELKEIYESLYFILGLHFIVGFSIDYVEY